MTDGKERRAGPSERPPEALIRERDAFIQQFFRKGAELTGELVKENERLRAELDDLEAENARLRAQVASDDAIRALLRKVEELEREKHDLLARATRAEPRAADIAPMVEEVERELANFASLYVATAGLHSAESVGAALRSIGELLTQLLGASAYALYFVSDAGDELVAIVTANVDAAVVGRVPVGDGPIGRAFLTGEIVHARDRDTSRLSVEEPAAVVPLTLGGRVHGVVSVFATLPHKSAFVPSDEDLFRLISEQVARALVDARLFDDAGRMAPPLRAFLT
jgi:hypothetical protein